ncbi:MAG: hypothetical protein QOE29_1457 [Gaiellaceae bacterium]|jgi:CheY-like chemotaxis protein|nr:hypothetical protein [Gaiellaceae bacterium]
MNAFLSLADPPPGGRVLVVDDHEGMRVLCAVMLHRLGYEPVTAAGTLEALEELETTRYDAVISDYDMPGADGIDLLRRVRARGAPVPFILMSAALPDAVAREALGAGATLAVEKSEVIESLPRLLERVLPARRVAPRDRVRSRERARPAALAGRVDAA